jgi:hypothetical protein
MVSEISWRGGHGGTQPPTSRWPRNRERKPYVVVQPCNPSMWEDCEFKGSLGYIEKLLSKERRKGGREGTNTCILNALLFIVCVQIFYINKFPCYHCL